MKGLESDLFLFTFEKIHDEFQILCIGDVFGHDGEIMSFQ